MYYSFETGELTKQFGEESDDDKLDIHSTGQQKYTEEEITNIRKLIGTNHRGHFWRYWMPKEWDEQPWIEVDMGRPETFNQIGITELFGKVRGYELQYFDGTDWTTFFSRDSTIDNLIVHLAKPITAQRVRLLITKTNGQFPTIVVFDLFETI